MTGRLIVVSNRVPSDGPPSGGLVVALHDSLKARGGLWIGTSGQFVDEPADEFRKVAGDGYDMQVFDLTEAEQQGYYLAYANSVLWPLCHRRSDLLALSEGAFDTYMGVNRRLAKMMARLIRKDDILWIHDYHFLPLAACLREEGVTATMGYFHHIPFPTPHDLGALPEREAFHDWIAAFDLVGLQSQGDVAGAFEVYRALKGAEVMRNGRLAYHDRVFQVRSFPIGIDAEGFAQEATKQDGRALMNLADGERLVIGVDRLDYSKGLDNRLRAFGQFLSARAEDDPRASLLQIAPPTREAVSAYRDIREQMERIAGTVNGEHSDLDWTPVRYIHRGVPRDTLAALYRAADVGFVTPFCDGMNLVAKEYVAAQDPEDPGVLILSQFAGAAEALTDAVIVNPHDTGQMARALDQALKMPLEERKARHEKLAAEVFENDLDAWTTSYLNTLNRIADEARKLAAEDA